MQNSKPVMLVEDDSADAITVKRAFERLEVKNPLLVACDGEEALDYLRDESNKIPWPCYEKT